MSKPVPSSANPATAFRRPRGPRFRSLRLALLLIVLGLVSLTEPRVFQFVVRQLVAFEAWSSGWQVRIGRVEGSLFEPVMLFDTVWTLRSHSGAVTRIEATRITADLAWTNLFTRTSSRWFQRLSLDGVTGKIELPLSGKAARPAERLRLINLNALRTRWMPVPTVIEGRGVDLLCVCGADFVQFEQARFRVSELEPGIIKARRFTVQQPWLQRSFPDVRGTTALQGSKLLVARLEIEPGVEIKNFAADLAELSRGRLKQKIHIEAFGGTIHAEAEMKPDDRPLHFEAGGTFSKIDIGRLAAFLNLSEAVGGTIKDGNFSFRGSPKNVETATTRLYVEATNFQWESRQWDSLVLGAELVDQRLQIHDCELHQGANQLAVSGELTLPTPPQEWWQSDFNCNVTARIENLTDLSALLLPEFTFAAGQANIAGSVRGHAEKFQGHLVIDGRNLRWRDAPVEELHATLNIKDNELQVAHFNLFNRGDYVRGQGVVNILGPTQYWGTLRASVEDLGAYAAILQKPIVPEPLAGGANIDWDGEGSAKGHSGQFFARLQKLRSLGASAARLHPINADLEGSYAAGGMVFSKFTLSDDESSFTANVAVGNKALALQGIRLMHKQQLWLEGDALLPLDVWRAWPNTSLETLLDDEVQSKVALTAYNLELAAASKLTGWNFPIAGVISGSFTAEGPLAALKTGGKVTLTDARLPLGAGGVMLSAVEGIATFAGQTISLVRLTGRHPTGDFRASGTVDLEDVRDPGLSLAVESERTVIPAFRSAELTASLDLRIDGPASSATVRGTATPFDLQTGGLFVSLIGTTAILGGGDPHESRLLGDSTLDATGIWAGTVKEEFPPIFQSVTAPWDAWQFDIAARGGPLPLTGQLGAFDLHLGGTGAAPELAGSVSFRNVSFTAGDLLLHAAAGLLTWDEGTVSIDARASGQLHGCDFVAHLLGPIREPIRFFDCAPPLSATLLSDALAGRYQARPRLADATRFALPVPAVFAPDVEVFTWNIADSQTDPPPPPPHGVSASHASPERSIQ